MDSLTAIQTPQGLNTLEAQIKKDLETLNYPQHAWVREKWITPELNGKKQRVLDVLIIGGGQSGLACAFSLMREKVTNLLVLDENPEHEEGPWRTFARMITLRTPKHVLGPDTGLPNLTFQAWYEAQHGKQAWQDLLRIPKETWADYLNWYRHTLNIPVENQHRAGAISWEETYQCFAIPITHTITGKTQTRFARKVVFATGIDGSGQWAIPRLISANLEKSHYAHTRENIDFQALIGKRIAVLGAGASAFDNAAVALETGAQQVALFFRRHSLPNVNPYRWAEFTGFLKHHSDLPDAEKWRFISQILKMGQLPPADTLERCTHHPNFQLHPGSPWEQIRFVNNQIEIQTPKGTHLADYIIIGTGFITNLASRPELAALHDKILLWQDRYTPPEADQNADLAQHPYLGKHFEYLPKDSDAHPYIQGLFNYTFGGVPSLGLGGASISGMKYSLPKLTHGITRQLYLDDTDYFFKSLHEYNLAEF